MRRVNARPLVVHVVGARPNYMKVAPVYAELERREAVEQRLVHTGQHYDAAVKDVFFAELPLPQPHVQLEVGSGAHGEQTARALAGLEHVFQRARARPRRRPGDVNSTLAGALAAVKLQIPVCHLEAGLRSFDWTMPEEHNRRLTDHLSTLLLTHSRGGAREPRSARASRASRSCFVGNTMIDTLMANVRQGPARSRSGGGYGLRAGGYVLVTLHRPALVDEPELLRAHDARARGRGRAAICRSSSRCTRGPWTDSTTLGFARLGAPRSLTTPLPYRRFLSLEAGAAAVVTDSGGVQEETTALGVPCFTLRDNTERPVTVTHGTNTRARARSRPASPRSRLCSRARRTERRMPPLWDGHAGERAARRDRAGCLERAAASRRCRTARAQVPVRLPSPLPAAADGLTR